MKLILSALNNPLFVFISVIFGTAAGAYLEKTIIEAFYWFIPCLFVIFADLISGISCAKYRKETIKFSTAARRTVNKIACYISWVIFCVALNERYDTQLCAWIGMGLIFGIEGISFLSNIMEPHGFTISIKGVLRVIENKRNLKGLEDIVEKKDNDKQS